jgi:hypothetical protein
MISRQSSVASRQSSVASRQSSVVSHQSSVVSHQSSVASHQSAIGSHQSAVNHRQSAVGSRWSSVVSRWSLVICVWGGALALLSAEQQGTPAPATPRPVVVGDHKSLFVTSENCLACHNGLTTTRGEDISIANAWRPTMMANSARDPYWQASVRRETIDHPAVVDEIQDECSTCHMPMSHTTERAAGQRGKVFDHLPLDQRREDLDLLAGDGVSCAICHQIQPDRLGTAESFTGGFVIDTKLPFEQRKMFGPFAIDRGRTTIMNSATGFVPTEVTHIRQSELCATCHTLYTTARGPDGKAIGQFPEQVPFLEWQHSDYKESKSCQSCHMPVVQEDTRMSSVFGEPRSGVSRHVFRGGNFFMMRMLNRYRSDLDVAALPEELERDAAETAGFLEKETARVTVAPPRVEGGRLLVDVSVQNLTGHKLPTAYPSRRAWLHLVVRDGGGRIVFESGRVNTDGLIEGNDNDADAGRFEPHYTEIRSADQVQIYESILGDSGGRVTTGLLKAVNYLKDNRLLPRGFDKATAQPDIAVRGGAATDADFTGGSDRTGYSIDTAGASGPFAIDVELLYEPIGYRWADNLAQYPQDEPARFVKYYREMSAGAWTPLARSSAVAR